LVNAC